MKKCNACGADVNENSRNCEYCGSPLVVNENNIHPNVNNNVIHNNNGQYNNNQGDYRNNVNMPNQVGDYTKEDIENNKVMAILSYIIPIVPYFAEKESKWVRYHAIQGMNLWIYGIILSVILTVITVMFSFIPYIGVIIGALIGLILFAVSIASFALVVIGIVNVCKMQARPLPVIDKIKIIKK